MELKTLIAECTAYDFKVMLEEKKPKSWLKSVSAFANGLGGSLLFGIDNDGMVKGLDDVQHVCEAISSRIRDYMDPLAEVEMIPHDRWTAPTPTQFQTIIFATTVAPNVGDVSEIKLTERQLKILSIIKVSPTITGKQMSETLSVSQRTIERDLSTLRKMGVLKREGKDNNGVWLVLEKSD